MNTRLRWVYRILNVLICLLSAGVLGLVLYGVLVGGIARPQEGTSSAIVDQSDKVSSTLSPTVQVTASETPALVVPLEPTLSTEQQELLDEMIEAMQAKDTTRAGTALKQWYEVWLVEENWEEFSGQCYNGQSFSTDYTGIALASDGTTRFYYGALKDGIPDGQGVRIALVDNLAKTSSYFWIEGTWKQGTLTGSGYIYMGNTPEEPYEGYVEHVEMQCSFDGTSEEIMEEAIVFQQRIHDYYQNVSETEVYQYSFHVQNGQLVEDDWELRGGQYRISAKDMLHENISSSISISELGESYFQNPFPWGQSYRFAYQPIFNCDFFIY